MEVKATVTRRPPERGRRAKRPDRSPQPQAPEVAAPVSSRPRLRAAAPLFLSLLRKPRVLSWAGTGDPFLGEAGLRGPFSSTLEYPRVGPPNEKEGTATGGQFVIGPDARASGISVHEGSGHAARAGPRAPSARAALPLGEPGRNETIRTCPRSVVTLKKGRG